MVLEQLNMPKTGEEIAVIRTNFGDIKIRLFPEVAPKAVENFKTHAQNGYYDGITFHRVIKDFMIQGGDPEATGRGGESIWVNPLKMNSTFIIITLGEPYPWPMQGLILTVANFS